MVLLFVTSCYIIWNLTTKLEMLEDYTQKLESFKNSQNLKL